MKGIVWDGMRGMMWVKGYGEWRSKVKIHLQYKLSLRMVASIDTRCCIVVLVLLHECFFGVVMCPKTYLSFTNFVVTSFLLY